MLMYNAHSTGPDSKQVTSTGQRNQPCLCSGRSVKQKPSSMVKVINSKRYLFCAGYILLLVGSMQVGDEHSP